MAQNVGKESSYLQAALNLLTPMSTPEQSKHVVSYPYLI
jgi:hypothetical protein